MRRDHQPRGRDARAERRRRGRAATRWCRIGRGFPIESNGSKSRVTVGFGLERRCAPRSPAVTWCTSSRRSFRCCPTWRSRRRAAWASRRSGPSTPTSTAPKALRTFGAGACVDYAGAIDRCIAVSAVGERAVGQHLHSCALRDDPQRSRRARRGRPDGAGPSSPARATSSFSGRLDPRNDVDVLLSAFSTWCARAPMARRCGWCWWATARAAPNTRRGARGCVRPQVIFAGSAAESGNARELSGVGRGDGLHRADRLASRWRSSKGWPPAARRWPTTSKACASSFTTGARVTRCRSATWPGWPARWPGCSTTMRTGGVMGRLARAAAERYDWRHVAARIEDVYRESSAESRYGRGDMSRPSQRSGCPMISECHAAGPRARVRGLLRDRGHHLHDHHAGARPARRCGGERALGVAAARPLLAPLHDVAACALRAGAGAAARVAQRDHPGVAGGGDRRRRRRCAYGRFALGGWLYLFTGILDILDGRVARAHRPGVARRRLLRLGDGPLRGAAGVRRPRLLLSRPLGAGAGAGWRRSAR